MPNEKQTLRQLLSSVGGILTIPSYQRRYVWGRERPGAPNIAKQLASDLIDAYKNGNKVFLQSITLQGNVLVDGQQRLTFLYLLLKFLGADVPFRIEYEYRPVAQRWMDGDMSAHSQDTFYFAETQKIIESVIPADISHKDFTEFLLSGGVHFLAIRLEESANAIDAFNMLNGTKSEMAAADIIKAYLLKKLSDQPHMRHLLAYEWEEWKHWWARPDVKEYFSHGKIDGSEGTAIDLLLSLCLLPDGCTEFDMADLESICGSNPAECFLKLRFTQKRITQAYDNPATYNMAKAIMLLQDDASRRDFLKDLFVRNAIDDEKLVEIYKLSFLGMTYDEILRGDTTQARFDDLVASLSMADVYHTEAKRDAFNLLLRLNIDEDIKLGRKFDFSIWRNRSLEHIFSKSMVWHEGKDGKPYDGNDNCIHKSFNELRTNPEWMPRSQIRNRDGVLLSEHCIGNLVLLYGENNAAFGNATFDEKKMMFLAPGDLGAFQSRNLLHSVCVFAGNKWDGNSIVDNYNLTLKNLKLYYGFK